MKLGHIEILAENPIRTKNFYCEVLGFEIVTIQNEHFIWLEKDGQEILIRPGQSHQGQTRYENASIGFVLYTNDVKETLKELQSKGVTIKGTVDSSKCYTFTDPDGNWFQLVNPQDH